MADKVLTTVSVGGSPVQLVGSGSSLTLQSASGEAVPVELHEANAVLPGGRALERLSLFGLELDVTSPWADAISDARSQLRGQIPDDGLTVLLDSSTIAGATSSLLFDRPSALTLLDLS